MQKASRARVLIVESLSPEDLTRGWSEARATQDILRTLNVESLHIKALSLADLTTAAGVFRSGHFDVLHLASHGCNKGIALTDGSFLTWLNFANELGETVDGRTLVLSACEGGCRDVPHLFTGLSHRPKTIVGPSRAVPWPELVIAWQVYYRAIHPQQGSPDPPCLAISRVQLATDIELSCYDWEYKESRYAFWKSCPACSIDVYYKTYPHLSRPAPTVIQTKQFENAPL